MTTIPKQPTSAMDKANDKNTTVKKNKKPCCFLFKYGVCDPPRGECRFDHDMLDDGVTPCCFGATWRLGHAKRVHELVGATYEERVEYWTQQKQEQAGNDCGAVPTDLVAVVVDAPAQRDANLLQSQLEPWSTAILRERLVNDFKCGAYADWEGIARNKLMTRLLECYSQHFQETNRTGRKRSHIQTTPQMVRPELLQAIQEELIAWRNLHGELNTRPSIHAESYMILRKDCMSLSEEHIINTVAFDESTMGNANDFVTAPATVSRKARQAQKQMQEYTKLWNLAWQALNEVDPQYASTFSALAVTYRFRGSPHIDKQNTGPFYGLSLGNFTGGGICVEDDFDTVAVCDSHNRFAKVDGRFPHWVDTYRGERYSLIYYSTMHEYQKPSVAYYGNVID